MFLERQREKNKILEPGLPLLNSTRDNLGLSGLSKRHPSLRCHDLYSTGYRGSLQRDAHADSQHDPHHGAGPSPSTGKNATKATVDSARHCAYSRLERPRRAPKRPRGSLFFFFQPWKKKKINIERNIIVKIYNSTVGAVIPKTLLPSLQWK